MNVPPELEEIRLEVEVRLARFRDLPRKERFDWGAIGQLEWVLKLMDGWKMRDEPG